MSTKIKTILALSLALLASVFIFSACNSEQHVHQYGEWTMTRAATCAESGEEARYCSCGDTQTRELPIKDHFYGEWVVVKAATCTEDGIQEQSCICGDKQTESISATGHEYGEWVVVKAATCSVNGSREKYCVCGDKQTESISANGHKYGGWVVTEEATCEKSGEKYAICSVCSDKKTAKIMGGHNWLDATCTTPERCSRCNITDGEKLGHTCKTGTCERCHKYVTIEVMLPNTPITVRYYGSTKMKITSLSYEMKIYSWSREGSLYISFEAEKTYDEDGKASSGFIGFDYAIKDSDGCVVETNKWIEDGYYVGDKIRETFVAAASLDLKTDYYTLEIYDYD